MSAIFSVLRQYRGHIHMHHHVFSVFGACDLAVVHESAFCDSRGGYAWRLSPRTILIPRFSVSWGHVSALFCKFYRHISAISTNLRDFARNFHLQFFPRYLNDFPASSWGDSLLSTTGYVIGDMMVCDLSTYTAWLSFTH